MEEDFPMQIQGLSLDDSFGDWKNWLLLFEHRRMGLCWINNWQIIFGILLGKGKTLELKVKNDLKSLSLQDCSVSLYSWSFGIS